MKKKQRTPAMNAAVWPGKGVITSLLSLVLLLGLFTATAAAAYVPDSDISQNRDGRQLIIRTYTLAPDDDPDALIEQPFELEGFRYTFSSISKEEQPFADRKSHSETVTVETDSDDLTVILGLLPSALDYELDGYTGTLTLDHNSLKTEATGYTTKSYTVSDTKTFPGLDRNDPSYVPKTTVKNGVTLSLTDIDWSAQYEALDDGEVVPSSYTAVAYYSGSASRKVADGYITAAVYNGEISAVGVTSVIYTVTYSGELIPTPVPEPTPTPTPDPTPDPVEETRGFPYLQVLLSLLVIGLVIAAVYAFTAKNTGIYAVTGDGPEYELLGKQRLTAQRPRIDLQSLRKYPEREAVIEIQGRIVRKLFGRIVTVHLKDGGVRTHLIERTGKDNYWFTISTTEEGEKTE